MRRWVLLACLFALGCGGSSPTSPSNSSAPPAPTYPNLIAAWSGTASLTIVQSATGVRATNICSTTWIVNSQNRDSLGGTFQLSGGTLVACGQSGTFTGTVSTTGSVNLVWGQTAGGGVNSCTTISGDPFLSGVASSTTMTLQQSVRLNCSGLVTDQIANLSLTRR